jgi:protein DGCR14
MSRNNRSLSRGSEEMSGDISRRIPKKSKSSREASTVSSNGTSHVTSATAPPASSAAPPSDDDDDNSQAAKGTSAIDNSSDPMAQALKAMQAYQSLTGETTKLHFNTASNDATDTDQASAAPIIPQKTEEELAAEKEQREQEEAAAIKKREEEEARERQRIKDGEAKRRAFNPKIATALDSLL